MLTVYLCDDNRILLEEYKRIILKLCEEKKLLISVQLFVSSEQLLFYIEDNPTTVDVIFLDILMGKTNGIEAALQLRILGCNAEIIFLTAYEEYVFDSFDVSPLHYLIKHKVTTEKFSRVFFRAADLSAEKNREFFSCECNGVFKKIPLHEISFFEIENRMVTVHFSDQQFVFYSTMEKLDHQLSTKGFSRCHRSFLVSLKHICELSKNELKIVEGTVLPIGVTYAKAFKIAYSTSLVEF